MLTNLSNLASALSTLSRSYSAIRLHHPVDWLRICFHFSSNSVLFNVVLLSLTGISTHLLWEARFFDSDALGGFAILFTSFVHFPHAAKQNLQTLSPSG